MKSGSLLTMLLVAGCATASTTSNGDIVSRRSIDWKTVEDAIGRPGVSQPGGVYRFNFPRGDLHVMVGDVQVKPALALGGWVAFKESAGGAIAAGDLVLTEDGDFVEIQGSGEESTFTQAQMDAMLVQGRKGITELAALQQQAIDSAMKPAAPNDLQKLAAFFGNK